ncbi:MAG TPA: exosortase A [Alphaproteobacteria bacterium]|nr:exosortase A [Alphaproteobacteria bacterium]
MVDTPRTGPIGFAAEQAWSVAAAILLAGVAAALALMHETARGMIDVWSRSATFGHSFLILPTSLYLLWRRRCALLATPPAPEFLAIPALAILSLAWMIAHQVGVMVLTQLTLVMTVQVLVVAVLGRRAAAIIAFPLCYLLFMVPAGEFLVPHLQDATAQFVVRGLRGLGIPVFLDGVFISIPTGNFEVAEACAGLRFLIATIAVGVLFAHVMLETWSRRLAFVVLCLAVPVVANGVRALGIVLIAHLSNNRLAVGVDHIVYGAVFLTLVMALLFAIGLLLRRSEARHVAGPKGSGNSSARPVPAAPARMLSAGLLSLSAVALGPAYASLSVPPEPAAVAALTLPERVGEWRRVEAAPDWRPVFAGADAEAVAMYERDGARVDLYVAWYARQRQGAEVAGAGNTLAAPPPWQRLTGTAASVALPVAPGEASETRLAGPGGRQRLAWRWFRIGDRATASAPAAKLLEAVAILTGGRRDAAAFVIATDQADPLDPAAERLAGFATALPPPDRILPR